MGEAKRRKRAGKYPNHHTDGGRAEDFRVPPGKIGITVDVPGASPSTLMLDLEKIDVALQGVERLPNRPPYYQLVSGLVTQFKKGRSTRGDLSGVAIGVLWTALNHPSSGAMIRERVSRQIREQNRAHVIWCVTTEGHLALAVGEQFVDLEKLAESAPKDRITTIVAGNDPEPPAH